MWRKGFYMMERSMGRSIFLVKSRLIRGDSIVQKVCSSLMIPRLETMLAIIFFLFHLFEKCLIIFLGTHMRMIYIKMLVSQLMDLMKYNQTPDFLFMWIIDFMKV